MQLPGSSRFMVAARQHTLNLLLVNSHCGSKLITSIYFQANFSIMEASELQARKNGICWRCRSIDMYFEDFEEEQNWTSSAFEVRWRDIGIDCALCNELKALLDPSGSPLLDILNIDLALYANRYVRGIAKYIGSSRKKMWTLLTHVDSKFVDRVWLVPNSIARHVDAELNDLSFVRSWIHECQGAHEEHCGYQRSPTLPLRLIDCVSRELCELEPGVPYVCLSYVWGVSPGPKGDSLPKQFPKTIEDAMWVALQLKIPYLWVDRYCIDQQNAVEQHHLIANMDIIYRGASLTIIAASGQGPHDGLPGINGTPRRQQYSQTMGTPEKSIIALKDPLFNIRNTVWHTRGWTYQEMSLSRRRLVFTEYQLYFQCNAMERVEALSSEKTASFGRQDSMQQFQSFLRAFPNAHKDTTLSTLYRQLEEYYLRQISFVTDTVAAVVGIVNAFELGGDKPADRVYAKEFHGLPVFYNKTSLTFRHSVPDYEDGMKIDSIRTSTPTTTFAHSLSWRLQWRHEEAAMPSTMTPLFPSWSWASVKATFHPHPCGTLRFPEWNRAFKTSDHLKIWVTKKTGECLDLDRHAGTSGLWSSKELLPMIHIQSWCVSFQSLSSNLEETYNHIHRFSGFNLEGHDLFAQDYPHIPLDKNLVAIYLGRDPGGVQFLNKSSFNVRAYLLVVAQVDELTWRRVGTLSMYPEWVEDTDTRLILDILRPSGGWELRTLCLV
jgi:hypothetical protein